MMSKKLSAEQDDEGGGELGAVITRTIRKAAKPAPKKSAAKKAEVVSAETSEEAVCAAESAAPEEFLFMQEPECEAADGELIERLVLLFGLPCVLAYCKCSVVCAMASGDEKKAALLTQKYSDLSDRLKALRKAEAEEN